MVWPFEASSAPFKSSGDAGFKGGTWAPPSGICLCFSVSCVQIFLLFEEPLDPLSDFTSSVPALGLTSSPTAHLSSPSQVWCAWPGVETDGVLPTWGLRVMQASESGDLVNLVTLGREPIKKHTAARLSPSPPSGSSLSGSLVSSVWNWRLHLYSCFVFLVNRSVSLLLCRGLLSLFWLFLIQSRL